MANGLFAGGEGTAIAPYLIEDAEDLNAIRNNLTANYKIINNIDMTEFCNNAGEEGWLPIPGFQGTLEGNGHVIKNLMINRQSSDYQGLFEYLRGGAIMNIGIISCNIYGNNCVGAFVGMMCTPEDLIENCFSTGNILCNTRSGGIAGVVNSGTIINSYSTVYMSITSDSSGIAGYMNGDTAVLKNCYSAITSNSASGLGCVGKKDAGTVTNCFFDATLRASQNTDGAQNKTTVEMQTANTFDSWTGEMYSFEKPVWIIRDGKYPALYFTETTKYFIFVNNKYMTYKDNEWIEVSSDFPSESQFEALGINDIELSDIPRYKWNELRQYESFDLIASTDKTTVDNKIIRKQMEIDRQYASCVVLKADIDFSELGDSINRIRIVQ